MIQFFKFMFMSICFDRYIFLFLSGCFCCFCAVYFIINMIYFIDWNIITLNGRSINAGINTIYKILRTVITKKLLINNVGI